MLLNVEKNRKNGRKNLVKKKKKMSQKKFEKKNLGKKNLGKKKIAEKIDPKKGHYPKSGTNCPKLVFSVLQVEIS